MRYLGAAVSAAVVTLALPGLAWAHAAVSPAVVESKAAQEFTLLVPTEKEDAQTTKVELTPPNGFAIDSFVPSPGWQREVAKHGSGEEAVVEKVTWSGGSAPTGEDAAFRFLASADKDGAYTFGVRQTYSAAPSSTGRGTNPPTRRRRRSTRSARSEVAVVAHPSSRSWHSSSASSRWSLRRSRSCREGDR